MLDSPSEMPTFFFIFLFDLLLYILGETSGPGCLKFMTLLVNVLLKFKR